MAAVAVSAALLGAFIWIRWRLAQLYEMNYNMVNHDGRWEKMLSRIQKKTSVPGEGDRFGRRVTPR